MSRKACIRKPASSRCLKKIDGPNCTSQECARNVRMSMEKKKDSQSPDIKDGHKIVGKYCKDCQQEALLVEKACMRCGSSIFIMRYAEDDQGIIIPSANLCSENPDLSQVSSYCPI